MKSAGHIIELWPSMADLGRDLGVPYSTVAAWKQRGSIPVAYWRSLIDAARLRRLGPVTSTTLIEAHDHAAGEFEHGGFAEDAAPARKGQDAPAEGEGAGQFSRWRSLRRSHFVSAEEAVEHIRALRSEWDRR